ncbi:MAG: epoxyqueuosine reductase QueH [Candidatus Aminicenantes bacterium]|nr:epoxyqueuosine reductase QueH [Candidatus Aminicenantes bacterium]
MRRLLLHVCCAPCSPHVLARLRAANTQVTGFFCNPNIQPLREFEFRRLEVARIAERLSWPVVYPPHDMMEWFAAVRGLEYEPERGRRCAVCFRLRLDKTFRYAREHGFDAVATTLSVSPYKVAAQINEQGLSLAREYGIAFLAENFKKHDGWRATRELAAALGVRHQDTCGCVFSRVERLLRLRK